MVLAAFIFLVVIYTIAILAHIGKVITGRTTSERGTMAMTVLFDLAALVAIVILWLN